MCAHLALQRSVECGCVALSCVFPDLDSRNSWFPLPIQIEQNSVYILALSNNPSREGNTRGKLEGAWMIYRESHFDHCCHSSSQGNSSILKRPAKRIPLLISVVKLSVSLQRWSTPRRGGRRGSRWRSWPTAWSWPARHPTERTRTNSNTKGRNRNFSAWKRGKMVSVRIWKSFSKWSS